MECDKKKKTKRLKRKNLAYSGGGAFLRALIYLHVSVRMRMGKGRVGVGEKIALRLCFHCLFSVNKYLYILYN